MKVLQILEHYLNTIYLNDLTKILKYKDIFYLSMIIMINIETFTDYLNLIKIYLFI